MRYFFSHIITALCLTVMLTHAHAADNRALKPSNKAEEGRRVALVIGNSDYTNSPLKNPVNDAKDVANKLRGLGFDVIERNNLKTKQIGGTLREFRSKLSPGAVALVFYAGHGLQIKGDNYLPAVDADINSEEDVPNQSLSMKQIMDVLDESKARLNLVFLDACRNNPYASRSFRSADRGLARVSAPSGTLISYATRPGSVAADGNGRNGLYTSKLLAQMSSSLQIELALKRVVTEVKSASQGKQEPWMEGSIEGDFCFGGCAVGSGSQVASIAPALSQVQAKSKEQIEDEYWEATKGSSDLSGFEQYLKVYPNGRYVNTAKLKIDQLKMQPHKITSSFQNPVAEGSVSTGSARINKIKQKPGKVSKERLVLMPFRFEEDKSLLGTMETAVIAGLQKNYQVFSGTQVIQKANEIFLELSRGAMMPNETYALQGIAEAFHSELIATVKVTKRSDDYFLVLSIKNIFDDKIVYARTTPCQSCNVTQVVEKLKEMSNTSSQTVWAEQN
jgi:hypothetical protein